MGSEKASRPFHHRFLAYEHPAVCLSGHLEGVTEIFPLSGVYIHDESFLMQIPTDRLEDAFFREQ